MVEEGRRQTIMQKEEKVMQEIAYRGKNTKENKYEDIIHLSRPVSKNHPPMGMHERAAQFSPFSALAGHEEAVLETARRTEEEQELTEDLLEDLNKGLQQMRLHLGEDMLWEIVFFQPDEKKEGGAVMTYRGILKNLDLQQSLLVFRDGVKIPMKHVKKITECYCSF